MTNARPRVAGVDPGTVTFDVCALTDGEVTLDRTFATAGLARDPMPLVRTLCSHGPFDLVLGPAGYGLPLVAAGDVGPRELSLMLLNAPGEAGGSAIGGMGKLIRALIDADIPVVFGPGAIHLATVPEYRKWNRIDIGTADKVASAALCAMDQARRHRIEHDETSFIMLELGGAFTAALAVADGQVVDGVGGSSGPIGAQAPGALDGEVAYALGAGLTKASLFRGGALNPDGRRSLADSGALERLWRDPSVRSGWQAIEEGAVKAVLALTAAVPAPREVLLAGRLTRIAGFVTALSARLSGVAPVRRPEGLGTQAKVSAQGAAILADGLMGGRFAALVNAMALRECSGTALDHVRVGPLAARLREPLATV